MLEVTQEITAWIRMLYLHNILKQPLKIMSLEKFLKKKKTGAYDKKMGVSIEVSTELETI